MRRAPRRLQQSRTVVWVWTGVFVFLALLFFSRTTRLPTHSLSVASRHLIEPGLHNVQQLVIHTEPIQQNAAAQHSSGAAAGGGAAAVGAQPTPERPCAGLQGEAYIACYRQHNPPPVVQQQAEEQSEEERHGSLHTGGQYAEDDAQQRNLPHVFLFMGILSGRGYRHRRLAVREAWASNAQNLPTSIAKFILSEDERTPQVQKELDTHRDIVFVRDKTNYKSILYKTFYVLEYAVQHYACDFVLKTDDDAFVNVPAMVIMLRSLCESENCRHERLYIGRMAKSSEVLLQPGHKWNNIVFHNHTGLKQYPNYMMGGGYVVSGGVARTLVEINHRMRLKFTPIEDATLGFWLMAMDLRHIDHRRFHTWAVPCCFKPPVRREGQHIVTRFQLAEEFEEHLCGADPWLILHKIDSPTKMRFVGARVANCTDLDLAALAMAGHLQKSYTETNGGASQVSLNELQDDLNNPNSVAHHAHQMFLQQQQAAAQAAAQQLAQEQMLAAKGGQEGDVGTSDGQVLPAEEAAIVAAAVAAAKANAAKATAETTGAVADNSKNVV